MRRKERLSRLRERRDAVEEAIYKVLAGQSYSLGTRSVTRANLAELRAMLADIEAEIDALEAGGSTRRRFVRAIPNW